MLQSAINSLESWSKKWLLSIYPEKCAVIRYSLRPTHESQESPYSVDGKPLNFNKQHRDLGILVSANLSWSDHINSICSNAYKSFYFIRRSISSLSTTDLRRQLYLTLVRSNMVYCSQLWRPFLIKDVLCLEKVQRRASKFILYDYSTNYKQHLIKLGILPLSYILV